MDNTVMLWLAGVIAFTVLEAITYQLVSIWFVLGAFGGLIAKLLGASFPVQMGIFIGVSLIALLCLRPFSKKLIKNKKVHTNVDSLLGKEVLVTKEVNNLQATGEGTVNGMTWTLRSEDNEIIGEGETVICKKIEGVKLIVKRKED